jgi:3-methylcrotonyl-CoA carboxylase alpha subunit
MLKKLLIANRGEIALRIMRTAHRLGVPCVAVCSEADRAAPFVARADEIVDIGPGPASESYLRIDKIIAAAKSTGADAIHPGYGFLAENAEFAEAVAAAGLRFIGPSPQAMRRMGGKAEAKRIASAAGVPVIPGYQGANQTPATLAKEAKRIGYPVMIKAVAGGGGRGMRLVEREADFAGALDGARREAAAAFGDDRVLIEKVIVAPRHIEVQVFGDSHGEVVHLFERDCSLQRRHQKVVEEAPAPGMSRELRQAITAAAVACAKAVAYEGAGTVEFLVEGGALSPAAPWYFIEMNTRLQVEHPVTEAITGLDLVEWQLRVAAGEPLPLRQDAITLSGHAIEARLCAEDPGHGFLPSTGPIAAFETPQREGVRIDAGVETGSVITPYYDSLIAKLIASGRDRDTAIARLREALAQTLVAGPQTNTHFLHALISDPSFHRAAFDTGLIGRELARLTRSAPLPASAEGLGVTHMLLNAHDRAEELRPVAAAATEGYSPWSAQDGFQLGPPRRQRVTLLVDGVANGFEVEWGRGGPRVMGGADAEAPAAIARTLVVGDGNPIYVLHGMRQATLCWPTFDAPLAGAGSDDMSVRAPIIGRVAKLFVREGEPVAKGDRIAVVEAMKMEHVLHAPSAGRVAKLAVKEGQQVTLGAPIATLAPIAEND